MSCEECRKDISFIKENYAELSTRVSALEIGFVQKEEMLKEIREDQKAISTELRHINERLITEIASLNGMLKGMSAAYKIIGGITVMSLSVVALMFFKLFGAE